MAQLYINNLYTVTIGELSSIATTVQLNDTSLFPTMAVGDWFYATLTAPKGSIENQWEIIKVTGYTATSATIVRAQNNTTPKIWPDGTGFSNRYVAADMQSLETLKNSIGVANGIAQLGADQKLQNTQIPLFIEADKLKISKTISLTGPITGTVNFDGSGNVNLATVVTPDGHTHTISNISDWPVNVTSGKVSYLADVTNNIQFQLNNKSEITHTHVLDSLSNVEIISPTTGQELYFNGTKWANRTKLTISHSSLSGLANDDHPQYLNQARADTRYAFINNAALTGIPTAPTAPMGTNTNQIATTEFVIANSNNSLADIGVTATIAEINTLVGITGTVQTQLNNKAQLSHTHTLSQITDWPVGVVAAEVSYLDGTSSNIQTQLGTKAPLTSPSFTGVPTVPTPTAGTNNTQIANTAFVEIATAPAQLLADIKTVDGTGSGLDADLLDGLDSTYFAPINSPALIGTPTVPTASLGTNNTQIANTAFVLANAAANPEPTATSYTYNADDTINTITETVSAGSQVSTINYTAEGKVNTVVVTLNSTTKTYTYSYDANGKVLGITKS